MCVGHQGVHRACAGVELERGVAPSEALVAALDSAHRALKEVCVQALCGLSWVVSQPSSSSRIVLQEQHSERKMGLCGSLAWHCSSLARLW